MTNKEAAKIIDHLGIKHVYDDTVSAYDIGEALTLAISALESIDRITAERDAAVFELRYLNDNCFCCKWWNSKITNNTKCQCPEPCCVDGNPDRLEWRGIQYE